MKLRLFPSAMSTLRVMNTHGERVGLVGCCGAALLIAGCGVSQPGRSESAMMSWLKHKITVGGRNDRNPLPESPAVVREGQTAFDSYCMVCHGLDGQNTGVPFAAQISPPIPSLASKPVQQYTDGQLKWIIENGVSPSGMPASRGILSDEEIWSIVDYLRHLPPAGSLGEPSFYSGACNGQVDQSFVTEGPLPHPVLKRGSR
jgi:mono/diheme cytochrome c family protein